MGKVWESNAQDLSTAGGAFATLALKDSELVEVVRPRTMCKIWEFNPQDVAKTACDFVTLAVKDYELLEAVRPAVVSRSGSSTRRTWRTPPGPRDACGGGP